MVDFIYAIAPKDIGSRMSQGTQQDWDDFAQNIESWDAVAKLLIALSKEAESDPVGWRAVIAEERDKMRWLERVFRKEAE